MRKLFLNLLLFVAPIVLLIFLKGLFYTTSGDLGELGKIPVEKDYRMKFKKDLSAKLQYKEITDIKKEKALNKIRILLIGDSYTSGQGSFGYANQLAEFEDLEVVLFQQKLRSKTEVNPIGIVAGLINSGYFEEDKFDYVLLESAERTFLERCKIKLEDFIIYKDTLENIASRSYHPPSEDLEKKFTKELNDFILFYQFGLLYLLDNNAFNSDVYKFPLTNRPFSSGEKLLVYFRDINARKLSPGLNEMDNCVKLMNGLANELSKLDVGFITVIAPDKYDVYYTEIENNEDYPEPNFFSLYNSIPKDYIDLECYTLLSDAIKANKKDVYFHDDAHWSPIGHEIISKALHFEIIKNQQEVK